MCNSKMSFSSALACFTWSHLSLFLHFLAGPVQLIVGEGTRTLFQCSEESSRDKGGVQVAWFQLSPAETAATCFMPAFSLSSRLTPGPRWSVPSASCSCCSNEAAPSSYLLPGLFTVHTGSVGHSNFMLFLLYNGKYKIVDSEDNWD